MTETKRDLDSARKVFWCGHCPAGGLDAALPSQLTGPSLRRTRECFAFGLQPQLSASGIDVMPFLATQRRRNAFGS